MGLEKGWAQLGQTMGRAKLGSSGEFMNGSEKRCDALTSVFGRSLWLP